VTVIFSALGNVILGAWLAAPLVLIGYWLGRRGSGRSTELRMGDLNAICGCGHHMAFHNQDTGKCFYRVWWSDKRPGMYCGCQHYLGPEHLPQVIP